MKEIERMMIEDMIDDEKNITKEYLETAIKLITGPRAMIMVTK